MTTAKSLLSSSLVVAITLVFAGCGKKSSSSVTINQKGSDTLVQVAQAWSEAYKKVNPGAQVNVAGGGSGTGIAALINGTIDICDASREMKDSEKEEIKKKFGKDAVETVVGYDALAVYTNPANPLKEISIEELHGIYAEGGEINNWEQIVPEFKGGIVRASRQNSSGTYEYFREAVCGKKPDGKTYNEFKQGASELTGSSEVIEFVAKTPTAVGYSGMGYKNDKVNWLAVAKKKGDKAVLPGHDAAKDGSYPIARKLYLYTIGEPTGEIKKYIDWILSKEGQAIVEKEGFVAYK
jgi:phosphate transport system substrate-binding protein